VEKDARRHSVHGTGILTTIGKLSIVFGMVFMILVSSFFGYFFGLTKTSRSEMRQKYIRRLTRTGGKKKEDSNTQDENLRQNFFIEEE